MKAVFMSGSSRSNVGKKDAKALRVEGLVPCVLYGGDSQIHFSVNETQFKPYIASLASLARSHTHLRCRQS